MKQAFFAVATLLLAGSTTWAATFSAGGGAGTSIVDANGTGDYTSLAEAAADFTSFAGGSTGDWTLLIRSDLTETTSSLFGNHTNDKKVTVRPAPGTSVTVTFDISQRPRETGFNGAQWDGNIVVGPSRLDGDLEGIDDPAAINYMDTDDFTIDGCNTPGGTERNLTLLTPESANTGTAIPRYTVRVVGGCDDFTIRNTTIVANALGNAEYMGILFNARFIADAGALFYLPHRGTVLNCGIKVTRGNNGRGVYCINQSPVGAASGVAAMEDFLVSECDIEVSHRAVQYGFNGSGTISYNHIQVVQESTGQRPEIIIATGQNLITTPFTVDIIGNHISKVVTVATNGFNYAIGMGGIAPTNNGATFNIINNMIGGFEGTANITTAGNLLGRAIAFEANSQIGIYNIRHNSIDMQDIANYGVGVDDPTNRLSCISFFGSNGFSGTVNFESNIVRYAQHQGSIISSQPTHTIGGTLNFNNNTYFNAGLAKFAEFNGAVYNTLTDWQTGTTRDLASNLVDPFAPPTGGAWFSTSNLHFNADPAAAFKTALTPGITTDFDKETRLAVTPKGADEFAIPSNVSQWMLY